MPTAHLGHLLRPQCNVDDPEGEAYVPCKDPAEYCNAGSCALVSGALGAGLTQLSSTPHHVCFVASLFAEVLQVGRGQVPGQHCHSWHGGNLHDIHVAPL